MSENPIFKYDEDERRRGRGLGLWLGLGTLCLLGLGFFVWMQTRKSTPSTPKQELVMVRPVAPPPPPVKTPPPPKQESEKIREEMIEQSPVESDEAKPEDDAPADPGLGTNLTGPGGPDGFGLSKGGAGGRIGGSGKKSGSRFGWYAAQVQRRISDAVQNHPIARSGEGVVRVRIWPDAQGRVTRAKLVDSTGSERLDTAIGNEVLTGLLLAEPPPADLPLPITLRITLRRTR